TDALPGSCEYRAGDRRCQRWDSGLAKAGRIVVRSEEVYFYVGWRIRHPEQWIFGEVSFHHPAPFHHGFLQPSRAQGVDNRALDLSLRTTEIHDLAAHIHSSDHAVDFQPA